MSKLIKVSLLFFSISLVSCSHGSKRNPAFDDTAEVIENYEDQAPRVEDKKKMDPKINTNEKNIQSTYLVALYEILKRTNKKMTDISNAKISIRIQSVFGKKVIKVSTNIELPDQPDAYGNTNYVTLSCAQFFPASRWKYSCQPGFKYNFKDHKKDHALGSALFNWVQQIDKTQEEQWEQNLLTAKSASINVEIHQKQRDALDESAEGLYSVAYATSINGEEQTNTCSAPYMAEDVLLPSTKDYSCPSDSN